VTDGDTQRILGALQRSDELTQKSHDKLFAKADNAASRLTKIEAHISTINTRFTDAKDICDEHGHKINVIEATLEKSKNKFIGASAVVVFLSGTASLVVKFFNQG